MKGLVRLWLSSAPIVVGCLLAGLTSPQWGMAQELVKDIRSLPPSSDGSYPVGFRSDGSQWTYFAAHSAASTTRIYRTDGTTVEALGYSTSQDVVYVWPLGSRLVFGTQHATNPGDVEQLHSLDLTTDEHLILDTLEPIPTYVEMGGVAYFITDEYTYLSTYGTELWRTDGTYTGTYVVKDANPGSADGAAGPILKVGSTLFFSATDGTLGTELWTSDGTATGTAMLKDILVGSSGSTPQGFVEMGGLLYFTADDGTNGRELWCSDGTATGTVLLKDLCPGSTGSGIAMVGTNAGLLYFWADDGAGGWDLWCSDGTAVGTSEIGSIDATALFEGGDIAAPFGSRMMFVALNAGVHELWVSDGTATGTVAVAAVGDSTGIPIPLAMLSYQDKVAFVGNSPAGDSELWVSDGTVAGTSWVSSIDTITAESAADSFGLTPDGSMLLFGSTGDYEGWGIEPHISDGTLEGTRILENIIGTPVDVTGDSSPSGFLDVNGLAYFAATDTLHGTELWVSDGTETGTRLVKDIRPGVGWTDPEVLGAIGDRVLFTAHRFVHGRELYVTDGTAESTLLIDIDQIGRAHV